jgi:predicted DNA-binding transcriptional regulator YafY
MFFGDLTKIKLEVDNNLLPLMKDKFNPEYYKITEKDDNHFIFETEIRGVNLFKGWLLSLRTQIKVLEPKFLKDELIEDAKNIISMYE